jgi:CRISPR-associated endonuclease/helicase Cas3
MAVLAPVGADGTLARPRPWGDVYSASLLQRTLELLERRDGRPITVPADVQELVDAVYAEEFTSHARELLDGWDLERLADDMAKRAVAGMVLLPRPCNVHSLKELTTSDADEALIATRLGAESVPVLPVYEDADGGRWLDEECRVPLPLKGAGQRGRFTQTQVRDLLGYVVPLAFGPWRKACGAANEPPEGWRDEPRLGRLVLVPQRVADGAVTGVVLGDTELLLDHALGLVRRSV